MKILALDISTKSTGWFVSKRSCGLIAPDPKLSFPDKLSFFRKQVLFLIKKYKPTVVVIEDVYLRFGNAQTMKQLARFSGVAMEVCAYASVEVKSITATQARKHCCGKQEGEFKKPEVFAFFTAKYNLTDWVFKKHNDITDAMALSWGYRDMQKNKIPSKKRARG